MIPFGLLKWRLWTQAYGAIYYNGTLIFGLFPFIAPFIKKLLIKKPKDKTEKTGSDILNGKQD